ncbi:MAG: glutamate racemase [Treponema sp.]|jgi:glutamate racemase|nr:glutamate racemase [Treponema sp.]
MDSRPIVFLDSGIGGIPYCAYFHARNPGETLVYVADRRNFPYGKRSRSGLAAILKRLVERIVKSADPKLVVLACNTGTVSALGELRKTFPILPFVGTVPALKPALAGTKTGKVGLLGTERTIEAPYIPELASRFGRGCEIIRRACPELVEFVELRYALSTRDEKEQIVREYIGPFREAGADALVLGCTHFLFLLEEFRRAAAPGIRIYDSVEGISRRVESLLDERDSALRAAPAAGGFAGGVNRFLITGKALPETSWQGWAGRLGFSLALLEETEKAEIR